MGLIKLVYLELFQRKDNIDGIERLFQRADNANGIRRLLAFLFWCEIYSLASRSFRRKKNTKVKK